MDKRKAGQIEKRAALRIWILYSPCRCAVSSLVLETTRRSKTSVREARARTVASASSVVSRAGNEAWSLSFLPPGYGRFSSRYKLHGSGTRYSASASVVLTGFLSLFLKHFMKFLRVKLWCTLENEGLYIFHAEVYDVATAGKASLE